MLDAGTIRDSSVLSSKTLITFDFSSSSAAITSAGDKPELKLAWTRRERLRLSISCGLCIVLFFLLLFLL
jgi:hypothetical protein